MFEKIYRIYEREIGSLPFFCREGCSTCCTQSVTMTSGEGRLTIAYLAGQGRSLPEMPDTGGRGRPGPTANELAACYLERREPEESAAPWVFEPCVFLAEDRCTIYPVRPFGCRSFGSMVDCRRTGAAEAPDWFFSLNTVVGQFIEHLDVGGKWGNMIDVLRFLEAGCEERGSGEPGQGRLRDCRPCPGLLIMPEDAPAVERFLAGLADLAGEEPGLAGLLDRLRADTPAGS